jgi:lipoprotein NlpI
MNGRRAVHLASLCATVRDREDEMIRCIIVAVLFTVTRGLMAQDDEQRLQQAAQAAQRRDHERAIRLLTQVIEQDPQHRLAWYLRGRENFRAGNMDQAVADFDKHVELHPREQSRQWERGIAFYYAGQYDKGAKQFADYQTYHNQDVENSVWRYLCVAGDKGVEDARKSLLPITNDPRPVMMEIYGLFEGKLKPEEVLKAATAGEPIRELENQQLFYAHLYVGLWHAAQGNAAEAKQHILEAEKHKIGHYMWDVAHVHAERLRK